MTINLSLDYGAFLLFPIEKSDLPLSVLVSNREQLLQRTHIDPAINDGPKYSEVWLDFTRSNDDNLCYNKCDKSFAREPNNARALHLPHLARCQRAYISFKKGLCLISIFVWIRTNRHNYLLSVINSSGERYNANFKQHFHWHCNLDLERKSQCGSNHRLASTNKFVVPCKEPPTQESPAVIFTVTRNVH